MRIEWRCALSSDGHSLSYWRLTRDELTPGKVENWNEGDDRCLCHAALADARSSVTEFSPQERA
jgi:hypothetical protein